MTSHHLSHWHIYASPGLLHCEFHNKVIGSTPPQMHVVRATVAHCSSLPLQWRHNGLNSVSNHQPHGCLLNRLFRCRSKKTSKLRITGLCAGNSPLTGEFPAQMASNVENVSIWWRHHDNLIYRDTYIWGQCVMVCPNLFKHSSQQMITRRETFVTSCVTYSVYQVVVPYYFSLSYDFIYISDVHIPDPLWIQGITILAILSLLCWWPCPTQTTTSWCCVSTVVTSTIKYIRKVLIKLVCSTITSAGMGMAHDRCHGKAPQDWMLSLNYIWSHW